MSQKKWQFVFTDRITATMQMLVTLHFLSRASKCFSPKSPYSVLTHVAYSPYFTRTTACKNSFPDLGFDKIQEKARSMENTAFNKASSKVRASPLDIALHAIC